MRTRQPIDNPQTRNDWHYNYLFANRTELQTIVDTCPFEDIVRRATVSLETES